MRKNYLPLVLLSISSILLHPFNSVGQPQGFVDQEFLGGWNQAVGMTFDNNGRMFVWEKGGKVYIVENGIKNPTPLIDISEEVGNWRDFGLLGFALDPNFLNNGYIYLLYLVDRHHLLNFGTGSYDPNSNEYFNATIGRITRYTAEQSTNFTTVDYSSRLILLGATKETGFPSLHQSHGIGSLVFATDGTLMVSLGDGASYSSVDQGSASETYWNQALADGIITTAENVGAYRSQMLNSLNGKILRIDPLTGNGIPSNPYYEPSNPGSVQSRVWAMGARNPYRMTIKPETGSHIPTDGLPGVFYFGDVGWSNREELNVITGPAQNFGWPKYEGMTHQPGYNNPAYAPSSHKLPSVDWRTGTPRGSIGGTIYNIGSAQIPGPSFPGNCSTGGVWYVGDDFPVEYKNTYFHADYGANWIHNFRFDQNDEITEVKTFDEENGSVVFLATHPTTGGLYYIRYGNAIHKISYEPSGNQPPTAIASADIYYGPGPLTVQFIGDKSTDPENGNLTYEWDFGNGPESTVANPQYTFNAPPGTPTEFTVRLTVMDDGSLIDETTLTISVNNTPPIINATSIDNIDQYSMTGTTNLNLSATVTDTEHTDGELSYEWQTFLYHDNHNHPETPDTNPVTNSLISPIGCDGVLYYYKVTLKVTDAAGLTSFYEKDIYPDCDGPVAINDNGVIPPLGSSSVIDILNNDQGSLDPTSVNIVLSPSYGNVVVNSTTGEVTYNRTDATNRDFFTYTVDDPSGNPSNVAGVTIDQLGPAAIAIINPPEAGTTGSSTLNVTYELSGDWQAQNIDRVLVTLDAQTPYEELGTSGTLTLAGLSLGQHTLTLQLSAGGTLLTNSEATATVNFEKISVGGGTGIQASYYNNQTLTDPVVLQRVDPQIDFNWGSGSPDPSINDNGFSARWQAQIQAIYDEQYTFYVNSDDGIRLYVDGQLIIDEWNDHAPTEYSASLVMSSGQLYELELEYYENTGGAVAELSWSSSSQPKEIIPTAQLFPPPYDQSISFASLPDKQTSDEAFTVSATASSGLPVIFSIESGPATIDGNIITLDGTPGTVNVRASQSGGGLYNPAPDVDRSFEVFEPANLPDPLAHWPLDGNGLDIQNGHDGVLSNGAGFSAESKVGSNSMSLDGTNDYLDLVGFGTGFMHDAFTHRTIAMWIKPDDSNGERNLFDEGGTGKGFAMRLNNGDLETAVRPVSGGGLFQISTPFPVDSDWHHVAAIFNGGVLELYLDGVLAANQPTGFGTVQFHDDPGGIGLSSNVDAFGSGHGNYYDGLIDDVKLFDVALDANQMQTLYSQTGGILGPPAVVITNPQEGSTIVGTTVVVDFTSTGNLSGADRVFLTLNSDPPVEITNLNGSHSFVGVSEGSHTVKAELALGQNILTNPEATDIINFETSATATIPDPLAHWPMDGTGQDIVNSHNGTPTNGAAFSTESKIGTQSLSLDGIDDHLHLVDFGTGFMHDAFSTRSLTMWIKPDILTGTLTLFDEGGNGRGFAIRIKDGDLEGGIRNGGASTQTLISAAYPTDGNWHHLGMVFNSSVFQLYIDGLNVAQATAAYSSIGDHTDPGGIGLSLNTDALGAPETRWYYDGLIDDVKLFDQALDAAQMLTLATGSGTSGPATVTITSPLEGSTLLDNNVDVTYDLGGDLAGVDRLFITLNSDPPVEVANLTGSFTFPSVLEGSHTVKIELANGSNILSNPEATDMVNFNIGPATVVIDSPLEGATIGGTDVVINYSITGGLPSGGHLHLTLDQDPHITIHNLTGSYTLTGVPEGSHTVVAELVDVTHVPLGNQEATDLVSFNTTLQVSLPDPIAHWPMEGSGQEIENGNDGTPTNGAGFSSDSRIGSQSLSLDGVNDYLDITGFGTGFMHTAFSAYSVAMWIKPNSTSGQQNLFDEGGTAKGIALRINNGNLQAAIRASGPGSQVTLTMPYPTDGNWHHVAAVFNNGTFELYLDGVLATSQIASFTSVGDHTDPGAIGISRNVDAFGSGNGNYFNGLIDDVKLFDMALDATQVMTLANESGTLGPATVNIINPQEGGIEQPDISLDYALTGDLSSVDRMFLTLNSDPPVEITNLSGSYSINGLTEGNQTITIELANGPTILTNPEATDVVNFSVAPPTLVISNPLEGGTVVGNTVTVDYSSSGDLSGADRVFLTLNSDPPVELIGLSGSHSFTEVSGGSHTVTAELAFGATILTNPEATDNVNFTTTSSVSLPNPLAHWPMEGSGIDIISGNDGTPTNGAGFSTDSQIGSESLSLDGVDDYFDLVGFGTGFMHSAFSTYSVTMWIKSNSTSGQQNLFDEGGTAKGIALRINNGSLEAAIRSGGPSSQVTIDTPYPSDGNWHHVAIVFNSGNFELYLDGVMATSQTTGFSNVGDHTDPGAIGISSNVDAFGSGHGSYFNGLIDDARLYGEALDGNQMQEIFNQQLQPANLDNENLQIDTNPVDNGYPANVFSLYPNPTDSYINIRLALQNSEQVQFIISDLFGRNIYLGSQIVSAGSSELQFDLTRLNLASGVYILKVESDQLIKNSARVTLLK